MLHKHFVGGFPGVADAGGLAIGESDGMDGVGVLVVQNKDVMVATAGRDWEFSCLIRVGFEECLLWDQRSTNLMQAGFKDGGKIDVRDVEIESEWR